MTKLVFSACLTVVLCVATATHSPAQIVSPGYTFTTANEVDNGAYGLSGFEFTVNQNVYLTDLGFTALSINTGGDTEHVTLWNATAGLGSLTQLYDTGPSTVNNAVIANPSQNVGIGAKAAVVTYVSLGGSAIKLTPGQTYLVTAPAYWVSTIPSSDVTVSPVLGSGTFLTAPGGWQGWNNANTTYNYAALAPSSPTSLPTMADFKFTTAPEPSTYALFGLGLGLLVFKLRRRSATLDRQAALETIRQRVDSATV